MSITSGELQAAGAAMLIAYAAAAALGVGPSVARRRRTLGTQVAREHLAGPVEAGWAAVQAYVAVLTALCAVLPGVVLGLPLVGLPLATTATLAAGTAVFIAGAALTGWAARTLGRQLTAAIEVRTGDQLVTRGPYARVRHPVYAGIFLMAAGLAAVLLDPVALAFLVLALAIGNHRAGKEEALLARDEAHGADYERYAAGTGRFLPRSQRGVK